MLPIALAKLAYPAAANRSIHKTVVHNHFPFYLQVRHARRAELFDALTKDNALAAVLRKDEGSLLLSDEARAIVRDVHEESGIPQAGRL